MVPGGRNRNCCLVTVGFIRSLINAIMTKYSKKASDHVEKTMHRMKKGDLKSGSGETVKDRDQAIAIALSEARDKGMKVPKEKASTAAKKPAPKKKTTTTNKTTTTMKTTDTKKTGMDKKTAGDKKTGADKAKSTPTKKK